MKETVLTILGLGGYALLIGMFLEPVIRGRRGGANAEDENPC